MRSSRTPLEVRILDDYIRDWEETRGGIVLFPKDHVHFDKLLLQNRFILFDKIFDFSGIVELVPEDRMDEDSRGLYRSMVELQCELSWVGLLKRSPHFRSYEGIAKLKEYVSGLGVDSRLTDMLNGEDAVLRLLRKIRPRELFINLSTFTYPLGFEDDPVTSHVRSYHDPLEVTWVISLSVAGSRLGGYKRRLVNVCELMDSIAEIILKVRDLHDR